MGGAFSSLSSSSQQKRPRKEPGGTISDVDRAVLDLKNARDRLTRYKKKLEKDEVKLMQRAKEAKEAGQTKTALGLLRLRRYKLREVENVEGQLLTVLQMVDTISSKENEKEVLSALSTGKDALERLHQETSLEDVLELMDQIEEQSDMEAQISEALQGVPSLSVEDEAQVEAELEALEKSLEAAAPSLNLPEVPNTELPQTTAPIKASPAESKPARVAVPS